jgi:hypothetical protein
MVTAEPRVTPRARQSMGHHQHLIRLALLKQSRTGMIPEQVGVADIGLKHIAAIRPAS